MVELTHVGGIIYQPEIHVRRCESHSFSSTDLLRESDASSMLEYVPLAESRYPISNERTDIGNGIPTSSGSLPVVPAAFTFDRNVDFSNYHWTIRLNWMCINWKVFQS